MVFPKYLLARLAACRAPWSVAQAGFSPDLIRCQAVNRERTHEHIHDSLPDTGYRHRVEAGLGGCGRWRRCRDMRNAILVTAAVATLTCPQKAWSQVSTTPTPLDKPFSIDRAYNDLQTLTRLYNAGEWARLEDATKDLLDAAKDARPPKDKIRDALDAAKHYIIVTWIGTDAFDKPMLVRVVVHGPRTMGAAGATDNAGVRGTPMVVDLPGVGAGNDPVYEVFFSRGTRGKIADVYVSSRDKNPISEELPAFVQAIASPLFETVGIFAGAVTRTENKAANGSIAATVSQVALPFERARFRNTHELVAEHATEAHVAFNQLQVGFADAGLEHPHDDLARLGRRVWPRILIEGLILENDRAHQGEGSTRGRAA